MKWYEEFLKSQGIEEEKIQGMVDAFKKTFPEHAVPKQTFNETNEKLKAANTQLEGVQDSLKELENKDTTIEDLNAKIATLQEEHKTYVEGIEKAELDRKVSAAMTESLIGAGMNPDVVDLIVQGQDKAEFQIDKKGKLVDAEDFIAGLKESKASLFTDKKVVTPQPDNVDKDKNPGGGKSLDDMSMEEYYASLGKKPLLTANKGSLSSTEASVVTNE